jgi:hypothetical protein
MNRIKFIISSIIFVLVCNGLGIAQTSTVIKKIHGFQQTISGGAAVSNDGENPSVQPKVRYYIFLETSNTSSVTLQTLYINGIAYSATINKSSPYVQLPGENKRRKLVSTNANKLWLIEIKEADETVSNNNSLKTLVQKNDVVLTGFAKGKKFTHSLKQLKNLKPLDAE